MSETLKVLMMGGQRVGKSSALAAIMESFMKPPINELFNIQDVTVLEKKNGEKQESIQQKLSDAQKFLRNNVGKTRLVSSGKTSNVWHYQLSLSVPDRASSLNIVFTDINGEFYELGNLQQDYIITNFVEQYDAFIIAVDTTYLMESYNDKNKYVNSIVNIKYNFVDDIHTFLSCINGINEDVPKLVIFTPIKCETWVQSEEGANQVVNKIKEVYRTAIKGIKECNNIRIEFLPIQTMGNVYFAEHLPARVFKWRRYRLSPFRQKDKCSELIDGNVRLADGTTMEKSRGEVIDDADAILIDGTDIVRPNTWFTIKSPEYKPHNCEQLALHILDFMLRKYIDDEIRKRHTGGLWTRISRLFRHMANSTMDAITNNYWSRMFGDISVGQVDNILNVMNFRKLIKYSGEGIDVFKDVKFLTK